MVANLSVATVTQPWAYFLMRNGAGATANAPCCGLNSATDRICRADAIMRGYNKSSEFFTDSSLVRYSSARTTCQWLECLSVQSQIRATADNIRIICMTGLALVGALTFVSLVLVFDPRTRAACSPAAA